MCSSGSTDGRARRFLPFMEGPRSCAGLALANMNLTATLALLYGHFSFRLADEVRGATLALRLTFLYFLFLGEIAVCADRHGYFVFARRHCSCTFLFGRENNLQLSIAIVCNALRQGC